MKREVHFIDDDSEVIRNARNAFMEARTPKEVTWAAFSYRDILMDHPVLVKALDNAIMRIQCVRSMKKRHNQLQYLN